MDPSGTDQTPQQTPPQMPPAEPPAWGQPGQPGQPGVPPASWVAPAPAPKSSRRLYGIVAAIVVVVVIAAVGFFLNMNSGAGTVMFSKGAYNTGSNCKFDAPVTQVTSSDPFYLIAYFKDEMKSSDTFDLSITKDGASFLSNSGPADSNFNCYVEKSAVGPWDAGVYKVTFTHDGKVEAEGTLTVK